MTLGSNGAFWRAAQDFRRLRQKADLEALLARLTGQPVALLPYEEVRQQLRAQAMSEKGLRDIPLDAIIGSAGRYTDFTRSFLPRQDADEERWARVLLATNELTGLPPIEVYQIGEAYFVKDGHHRISVARSLGATHIQAYVTEVQTRVPLTPDVTPEALILKAEYAGFLEQTRLDELRPGADLTVTVAGKTAELLEHIQVHQYFMGLDFKRDVPYAEAVTHWYDTVYLPFVQVIRARQILREFPGRTEADLYLWCAEHRAALETELGWQIDPEEAAVDLLHRFSPQKSAARVGEKLRDWLTPDGLEAGPPPGEWRRMWLSGRQDERLFSDLLVPISGRDTAWAALTQAIEIARREGSRLRGLHVVGSEAEKAAAAPIQAEFARRCAEAGIPGNLVVEVGEITRTICDRSGWTDLVVVHLAYPPAPQPAARLSSGFSTLVRRCPRPILAVPQAVHPLERALLAYDGSPKAEEALFVATYLAGHWGLALTVLTVAESERPSTTMLAHAQEYLAAHDVAAEGLQRTGPVAETILQTATERDSNLLIVGGYGFKPMLEVVLGSTVDALLRASRWPVLICR